MYIDPQNKEQIVVIKGESNNVMAINFASINAAQLSTNRVRMRKASIKYNQLTDYLVFVGSEKIILQVR